MANEEKGYVYILTNPAFREDWVKIGKSSRPVNVRSKELDNTAVPLPFEIYATMQTSKYSEAERLVHRYIERFTNLRIRDNREFFNVKPEDALEIFYDVQELLDDAEIEVFQDKAPKPRHHSKKDQAKPTQHLFFCTRAGSDARGYYVKESGEFVVLAGSEFRSGECDSLSAQSVEKRQAFVENYCSQTDGKIILNTNYTFPSPSAAAAMVVGGSSNGWTRWKDADNKTLDEVFRAGQTHMKAKSPKENKTQRTGDKVLADKLNGNNIRLALNGRGEYSKRSFVLNVIKTYLEERPNTTFEELKQIFPQRLAGSWCNWPLLQDDFEYINNPKFFSRYHGKNAPVLRSGDGVKFMVCNQWDYNNLSIFLPYIEKLGMRYEILN